jgi:serine phosphatase RsbU (regulator of sigma subunit)
VKNFFGFGKGSRDDSSERAQGSLSDSLRRDDESFLTGDERTDATNVNLLLSTIADVNSTIDLDQLLVSIVDKSIAVTKAERGFLLLRENAGELTIKVARDNQGSDLPKETRFSTKITNQVESNGEPVRSMVNSDAKALELSQSVFDLKIRAVMCVPLRARKGKTMGVIYVDSRIASREFSPADIKFFAAFATQATIAFEKAQALRDSLEKERMSQELRIAQQIQQRMLPRAAPKVARFDLASLYEAASEAAGDSYDYMTLRDGKLVFVVTDVSGHGIGPALVTMSSRSRLRTYLEVGLELGEAVTRLNANLREELDDGMFQTLFIGVLDPKDGTLRYVNAGHPPPIVRRASGTWERWTRSGIALGLPSDEPYEPRTAAPLRPGDFVFAFTDGLPEAKGNGGDLFGETRIMELLLSSSQRSAREMIAAVVAGAKAFAPGGIQDDLTLLCLRATP